MNIRNRKGITLVALVITIVILLILAGISIQALKETNLFEQAEEAKRKTENAQIEENEILANYLEHIEKISGEDEKIKGNAEATTVSTHTATEIAYEWNEIVEMAKVISNTNSINEDTLEIKATINNEIKILGVGDTKILDGKTVRILGFNHDTLSEPSTAYGSSTATGKAGISFEYVDFLTSTGMNSSNTNSGGWVNTAVRGTLNETTYNSLSIKNSIKKVKKEYIPTYNKVPTIMPTTDDYLWLLSCGEIWDNGYNNGVTRGYAIATEGKQYKYYKMNLGSTKYNTSTDNTRKPSVSASKWWWLRSPYYDYSTYFCIVGSDGTCPQPNAGYSYGVAPGFSI